MSTEQSAVSCFLSQFLNYTLFWHKSLTFDMQHTTAEEATTNTMLSTTFACLILFAVFPGSDVLTILTAVESTPQQYSGIWHWLRAARIEKNLKASRRKIQKACVCVRLYIYGCACARSEVCANALAASCSNWFDFAVGTIMKCQTSYLSPNIESVVWRKGRQYAMAPKTTTLTHK